MEACMHVVRVQMLLLIAQSLVFLVSSRCLFTDWIIFAAHSFHQGGETHQHDDGGVLLVDACCRYESSPYPAHLGLL